MKLYSENKKVWPKREKSNKEEMPHYDTLVDTNECAHER